MTWSPKNVLIKGQLGDNWLSLNVANFGSACRIMISKFKCLNPDSAALRIA
jgi:hypothetical protein